MLPTILWVKNPKLCRFGTFKAKIYTLDKFSINENGFIGFAFIGRNYKNYWTFEIGIKHC